MGGVVLAHHDVKVVKHADERAARGLCGVDVGARHVHRLFQELRCAMRVGVYSGDDVVATLLLRAAAVVFSTRELVE